MRVGVPFGAAPSIKFKPPIDQLKAEGRFQEIQKTIKALKKEHELNIPKDLAYVEGKLFEDYIHDMKLTQQFAMLNRKAMVDVIMTGMGLHGGGDLHHHPQLY